MQPLLITTVKGKYFLESKANTEFVFMAKNALAKNLLFVFLSFSLNDLQSFIFFGYLFARYVIIVLTLLGEEESIIVQQFYKGCCYPVSERLIQYRVQN